jgi:hypothetical protein
MLRIKTCLLISLILISLNIFSQKEVDQEEIWGYNTLAGSKGGGAVFKVDPDDKTAEIIHRFGHGLNYSLSFETNKKLFNDSNGLIYGTVYDYGYNKLYAYNPLNDSIKFLKDFSGKIEIIVDDVIFLSTYYSTGTEIFKYDIELDSLYHLMSISEEKGERFQGYWIQYDSLTFYTLAEKGGENNAGTIIKIDLSDNTSEAVIHFNDDKYPQYSLLYHSNGKIYFTLAETEDEEYDEGGIFEFDPINETYTQLAFFNDDTGVTPYGELFESNDGIIYGLTEEEGEHHDGSIYRFNPVDNSIEVVLYIDDDTESEETYAHYIPGGFIQINDHTLMGILEKKFMQVQGKLFYLDLETNELTIVFDFEESEMSLPRGSLLQLDEKIYGVSNDDAEGIFSYDTLTQEVNLQPLNFEIKIDEYGQNPVFLCQGHDYNFYGMTAYGGKEDKGIAFKIDYITKEFTKLMDLADLDFSILPKGEGFAITPGKIVGISSDNNYSNFHKSKNEKSNVFIYEFDYIQNSITKLKDLNISDYVYGPRMNTEGNIYFSLSGTFYEYFYNENSLIIIKPDSMASGDIIQYNEQIYIGYRNENSSPYHMLFEWNRNTNSTKTFCSEELLTSQPFRILPAYEIFISDNILYGTIVGSTPGGTYYNPYVYDLKDDTIIENEPLYGGFDNNFNHSMIETVDKQFFIQQSNTNTYANGLIEFYDKTQDTTYKLELEESEVEFTDNYYYGWISVPGFDFKVRSNLISAEPHREALIWTGITDTNWYESENWFLNKTPNEITEVYIPPYCPNYPIINKHLETGNLNIEKKAEFTLLPQASLTSLSLSNKGELIMGVDSSSIASVISLNSMTNFGEIKYFFNSEEETKKLIASPLEDEMINDSSLFQFDGNNWNYVTDSLISLTAFKPYLYEMDSAAAITFGGDFNWGDQSHSFDSNPNQWTPLGNPYAASFDWQQIDLSSIELKAVYSVDPIDSTIYSFVDGIGTLNPIIQPLDVFWVNAQSGDEFRLSNDDQIHMNEYNPPVSNKNELQIAVLDGETKNQTIISFNNQATNEFEKDKDALLPQFENYQKSQIFTFAGEQKLAINQLPGSAIMDMAVKAEKDGTYTIQKLKNKDFDFVVLEDLIWNKRINLLEEEYSFDYFVSDGDYPFKLYFEPWALEPVNESDIDIYFYSESLIIRSRKEVEYADVFIYDMMGKLSLDFKMENSFFFKEEVHLPTGHYIAQFRTKDVVINRKIWVLKF